MKQQPVSKLRLLAAALLMGALVFAGPTAALGDSDDRQVLVVDVAMDGNTFSFQGKTNPKGFPAKGTPFIIEGYIYPKGTFAAHGRTSGVLPDGKPQFPALVVGKWICRGWHLQDGDATTGSVVATTQIFDFDLQRPGSKTVISDGIELADFDLPFKRAITGGTGSYRQARGELIQTYVDFNATGAFNTSFELDPRPSSGGK